MDDEKRDRLDAYLAANDLGSVWLMTPPLFGWLTGGDPLIDRGGAGSVAAAGYDGEGVTVVTSDIEGQRLRDEELPADVDVVKFPWHERDLADAVADEAATPAAADVDVPGFERVDRTDLTQPLTDEDLARYQTVSEETARAVESVAREASPGDTERALAAELHRALQARGIDSPVVLVGGEDRLGRYRHFTPKDVPVEGYAVLTVVGVRQGCHVAVTRTVAFDDAPGWLDDRHETVSRVAATAAAATRAAGREDGTAGDAFGAIQDAYTHLGYEGEWANHHQGGALGFASREWVATPDLDVPVRLPTAFGWNPTVPGAKSEDTVLVTADGVDRLSETGEFPTRTVEAVGYDHELSLPDILRK
ncbi:MAG: M24 family metallopeptidase [Haloarculaceae archaeon]